jgi:hypothetical protein
MSSRPIEAPVEGSTKIITGDWCLEVHTHEHRNRQGTGYRRYHRHMNVWYCVISKLATKGELHPDTVYPLWQCGHCGETVPEEMEGYINLARYALDAD